MNRRAFFATVVGVTVTAKTATAAGLHVDGRLLNDAPDGQPGYFVLCGEKTGVCQARNAIGISVHPDNAIYMDSLSAMVGKDVQVSIFQP